MLLFILDLWPSQHFPNMGSFSSGFFTHLSPAFPVATPIYSPAPDMVVIHAIHSHYYQNWKAN